MDQSKKYDLLILLAGENERTFPRSSKATSLYRKGLIGDILVSGSAGGFADYKPSENNGSHTIIANYLNIHGVPADHIYLDWRPLDTLGNFAFPYAEPLNNNPNPNELSTAFLTEWGHIKRALECVSRVVPLTEIGNISSPGEYGNRSKLDKLITKMYHKGLMFQTEDIDADPQEALQFLKEEHPFYQPNWFDKPISQRKLEMMGTIITWLMR